MKYERFVRITKVDDEQRMVWGYASTPDLDGQGDAIPNAVMREALPEYMRWANVREMHQLSAVGKTLEATVDEGGLYIGAHVVDDVAWRKVKSGVYNGFSIGGALKRRGEEVVGLHLLEISLVDRPANPHAVFDVWKAQGGSKVGVDLSKWGGPVDASQEDVNKMIDGLQARHAGEQKDLVEKAAGARRELVDLKQAAAQTLALQAENEQLKAEKADREEKDQASAMKKLLDGAQAAGKFKAEKRSEWEKVFKSVGEQACASLLKDAAVVVPIGQRIGVGGDGEETTTERCEKVVRQIMKDESVTYDVAFAKAYQRNTKLFQQRDNEQLAASRGSGQGYGGDSEE